MLGGSFGSSDNEFYFSGMSDLTADFHYTVLGHYNAVSNSVEWIVSDGTGTVEETIAAIDFATEDSTDRIYSCGDKVDG